VTAAALHGHTQHVNTGGNRTRSGREHAVWEARRRHVHRVRRQWSPARGVEHTLIDHVPGPVVTLLARLEHEHHIAGQGVAVGREQPGSAHQHGGVQIVAAGMHPAGRRGKVQASLLRDRQRVHVRVVALRAPWWRHHAAPRSPTTEIARS
jgi:hypothetical protein